MQKGMLVKDIKAMTQAGAQVSGVFAIASSRRDLTKNGLPYWQLVIQDCSGAIGANIWSPLSNEISRIPVNAVAFVAGVTREYKGQTGITANEFEELGYPDWQEIADELLPESPANAPALYQELCALCARELRYPAWGALLSAILGDPAIKPMLLSAPAAKSCHQAYRGGLLEHLLGVARICLALADLYPWLDRQLLLAGAILHDIGKIQEYSGALAIELTQTGMLFGHSFLGLEIIAPYLEKSKLEPELKEHLKHLVISHHGEHEYGAAALPQTPEAFILHYADNIDAKMGMCEAAFAGQEAPFWSEKLWPVQRRLLLPWRTPQTRAEETQPAHDQDTSQGLLLEFGEASGDMVAAGSGITKCS